jgi:hypothetical protein
VQSRRAEYRAAIASAAKSSDAHAQASALFLRGGFVSGGREPSNSPYILIFGKTAPRRPSSCDSVDAMKILIGLLAVLIVAASFFADYKWRQWMAARRRDRR